MINYCPNCGTKTEEQWNSCPYCGHNLQSEREENIPQQYPSSISLISQRPIQPTTIIYPPKEDNTRGIIALIFGLLGLLVIPIVGSIIAIVLGGIGRKRDDNPGMATAGLILGIIGLVIWIIGIALIVSFIMSFLPPMYYFPF